MHPAPPIINHFSRVHPLLFYFPALSCRGLIAQNTQDKMHAHALVSAFIIGIAISNHFVEPLFLYYFFDTLLGSLHFTVYTVKSSFKSVYILLRSMALYLLLDMLIGIFLSNSLFFL